MISAAQHRLPAVTVAALFVDPRGVYAGLDGVDVWGPDRDARTYAGPHPVVAHPPCQLWVNLAAVNFKRYGGEHNRPGNDGGCFKAALAAVREFGGVLEHPAFSNAWERYSLRPPFRAPVGWIEVDDYGFLPGRREFVCEVWRSAYGHPARKRTWLLYSGRVPPAELDWTRKPGRHQCGWFDRIKPTLGKKAASATPPAFRDALIALARGTR